MADGELEQSGRRAKSSCIGAVSNESCKKCEAESEGKMTTESRELRSLTDKDESWGTETVE